MRFCPAPLLTAGDVADVLATIVPRVRGLLERLCRYALRPTVAQDRLRLTDEKQVVLQLRHAWSDGTTHLLFEPLELLERLAVLIPRPRINLILYHGVLGPRAAWRSRVVGFGHTADRGEASTADASLAGEHLPVREARAAEPAPDPPWGREGRSRQASAAEFEHHPHREEGRL